MADEIKLKAPTVEQQVVVNINGEDKLKSFADTLDKISNNKNLQKYWKTQQDLINATADAYSNFQKKASKDNASELIKVTNALKAMSGTDLSHILPDFDKISKSMVEAQKVAGNIDSAFSVKGFKEAFDSFEALKAYGTDIQKLFSHFGVSSDIGELQQNVRLLEGEVEKLTRRLSNAKNANEELRNEFENFKLGSGFADKLNELDRLKAEMQNIRDEATQTFNQFLEANKIDRYDWYNNDRFAEYFDKLENGTLTASEAIRQFKTEYDYLLEESFKSNGNSFGLDQLQAFSTKLDSIFHQVEETSNKINDILSNGVIAKSVQNLSEDTTLSDSQRSIFGNILQDEESLKSITALFQKLIDETNQTKNTEFINTEQFAKIESLFTSIESSLSSIKKIIVDVGDGEEFSPLLSMINKINSSISELSSSVKNIGFNMNIDVGSDTELEAKIQSKMSNALQAYQRLFEHIKMSGVGGSIVNTNFFEFDINQFDTMMAKIQAYRKFIENMRNQVKSEFGGKDLLYTETDKKYWTSAAAAMGQLTKAQNEMNKSADTNPIDELFGKTDLTGIIEQLNLIVSKLDEISMAATKFSETFSQGLSVTTSVEEVSKLTEKVKELETELEKVKSVSTGSTETNILSGMNDAFPDQDVSASVESATNSIKEENNVLEQNTQKVKENTQAKEQNANVNLNGYDKRLDSYNGKIDKYQAIINRFNEGGWTSSTYLENVQAVRDAVKQYATLLDNIKTNQNGIASDEDIQNLDKYEKKIKDTIATVTNMSASEKGYNFVSGQKELDKIHKLLNENSKMSSEAKAKIKAYYAEIESGNPSMSLDKIHGEIMKIYNAEVEAGRAGKSLWDIFKTSGLHQIVAQAAGMFGVYDLINVGKQFTSIVIDINSQITELAKVSEQTSKQIYGDFDSYADIAKEVRGTISDTISATADWSKNGYSIPDSKQLAEISQLYKNVGDGIDIDQANESLISTLKGFQLEADQAEHIVDVFNEVSNNEAISSAGIGEALQRSAASFNAASTSLEKSVSLVTATNSVLQDPEKVGNMWRTVSARLRGSETELKEMGEDTDGLVTSTSKLQALVKGITGFDIMKDKDTYKDIYDIVLGIGEKWKDLSDIDRASLLEALAGKQQSNALAAALSNIDILKKSYEEATNAEGSARKENEEYSKSIQASIDLAQAKLEQLANDTLNSDFLKGAIDAGGKLIDILDGIVKSGNAISIVFTTISGYLGSKNLGWQTKMTLWCDAQYIPRAEVRILG